MSEFVRCAAVLRDDSLLFKSTEQENEVMVLLMSNVRGKMNQ